MMDMAPYGFALRKVAPELGGGVTFNKVATFKQFQRRVSINAKVNRYQMLTVHILSLICDYKSLHECCMLNQYLRQMPVTGLNTQLNAL